MKKILSLVMAMALLCAVCLSFSSCADDKKYTVGIVQFAPHVALDAATKGFRDALIAKLGEDNIEFDYQNATGETNTCVTIVNNFVAKNVDLIMANATSALQAAAGATTTIPILGTSITEYGTALEIENFNGTIGGNISGTSDLAPLTEQADMLMQLFPNARKVGLLYCSAEPNSAYQIKVVKQYLEGKGLTCTEYKFSDSNDVTAVTERAASESDVIYIPTDNMAATCAQTIGNVVRGRRIPVIAGEEGICSGCGTATLSIDYYELGYKTGEMAADILTGERNISQMPVEYVSAPTKKYNAEICTELGITIPDGYEAIGD